MTKRESSISTTELTTCDREPIHKPGSIQPHGVLIVCDDSTLEITRVSENSETALGKKPEKLIGKSLSALFSEEQLQSIHYFQKENAPEETVCRLFDFSLTGGRQWIVSGHRFNGTLFLEFEKKEKDSKFFHKDAALQAAGEIMRKAENISDLASIAAKAIRDYTGFDRVLIYTFLPDNTGEVIGEAKGRNIESFLHFRFPESDIPKQARELYRRSPSRSIVDANFVPVPLYPPCTPEDTPDLSYCILRSVSPIHLEYMRNMGTMASSSFSIIVGDRLEGLISLHHRTPKEISYWMRKACERFTQHFSLEYRHQKEREETGRYVRSRRSLEQIIESLRESSGAEEGLICQPDKLLTLMGAGGMALRVKKQTHLFGDTPDRAQINRIRTWLKRMEKNSYQTSRLAEEFEPAKSYINVAAGLLAIPLLPDWSRFIMWFRPEVVRSIAWAGKPTKIESKVKGKSQLHPRNSFALWRENIRGQSLPWSEEEKEIGGNLLFSHISLMIEYEERVRAESSLKVTTEDLTRTNAELASFAYVASHDLQEPLRAVAGCLQILRKRYDGQLDDRARELIRHAVEGSMRMQNLINDLLAFSRVGTHKMELKDCDVENALKLGLRNIGLLIEENEAIIDIERPLPTIEGDETLISLVFQNLIGNAIKFRSNETPKITIASEEASNQWHFTIADNGIGIDPKYREKIFVIFQRLHTRDQYSGTGIGLALCKKIIERHNGTIWVEPNQPKGSVFHFLFPRKG